MKIEVYLATNQISWPLQATNEAPVKVLAYGQTRIYKPKAQESPSEKKERQVASFLRRLRYLQAEKKA